MTDRSPIAIVRHLYELYDQGKLESAIELLHPDIVVDEQIGGVSYSGVYRGLEGFRTLVRKMAEAAEITEMRLGELLVGDETTAIAANRMTFRSRITGRSLTVRSLELFRIKDGKIIEIAPRYDGSAIAALDRPEGAAARS